MIRPLNDVMLDRRSSARAIAGWFENFDRPLEPAVTEAPAAPALGPTELELARQEGWNEGFLAACRRHGYLAESAEARAAATLLHRLEALDQRISDVADVNAIAIARWLAEALEAIVPALLQHEMEKRVAATAAVLRQTLRSVGVLEVRRSDGVAVSCSSAEEAGQVLVRLRDETADPGGISISWQDGKMCFDDRRVWADISAAILPITSRPAVCAAGPTTLSTEAMHDAG